MGNRIWPIGDSITAGAHSDSGDGYRGFLDGMAEIPHTWVGSQVSATGMAHEGHSGWTIAQLAAQAQGWAAAYKPWTAIVNAGTNDNGNNRTAGQMIADMRQLINAIRAGSPTTRIIVMQITLTPYNSQAQQQTERDYNAALPAVANEFQSIFLANMETGVHISEDRVHPDDQGYQTMAERLAPFFPKRFRMN